MHMFIFFIMLNNMIFIISSLNNGYSLKYVKTSQGRKSFFLFFLEIFFLKLTKSSDW